MVEIKNSYEVYKDSGVEWLGKIPEHWEVMPAKRFHQVLKEVNKLRTCDNVLSLTLRGVVNNNLDNPEGLVPKDYATYQYFEKDNLVFKLIDLENVSTSRVGIVHENGIMSSAYIRLIVGSECQPKYVYYYYFSLYKNEVFNKIGSGVRSTLGPSDLLDLPFIRPNSEEQTAIAAFLDDKTAKIDQAIAIKEQQIASLKERKQIINQEAVTKGLDKTVKYKDSGVEWIRMIPEHWEVKKAKYLLKERSERSKDGSEPLFMMSQTHGLVIRSEYHSKAEIAKTSEGNKVVYQNDLVFNKLKAHLGVFFKSTIEFKGIVSPDYAVYYSTGIIKDLKYLELLYRNPAYIKEFICRATGIVEGLIRLYTADLFDIYVPVPPAIEQKEILEHIENMYSKIDQAVFIKKQEIEKLKEYKVSLIDAVVTGKVKV